MEDNPNTDQDQNINQANPEPAQPEAPAPSAETPAPNDSQPAEQPAPVVSDHQAVVSGSSKKGLKLLVALLVLVILAALAYLGWKAFGQKSTPAASTATIKKDVPVLRIGTLEPVNNFYPSADSNSYTDFSVNAQVFEGLVRFDNLTKIVPVLAKSWTNPDANTWIFTLQPNVHFHTGNVMTANDVKYSIEKYQKTAYGGEFAFNLKSVDVINNNQVKITTDGPDPLLLHRLAYLAIVDSKLGKDDDPMGGTGAYTVKPGTSPSDSSLDLVAFNQYHGGHVYTHELQWSAIVDQDEDKLAQQTAAGKIDFAMEIETLSNVEKLKQKGFVDAAQPTLGIFHIGFNVNKAGSPVQNLKFRQALDAGLDRQEIIKAAALNAQPASQIVPQLVPGYNPAIKATPYDPAKAKALLAEAGYSKGTSFTLTYTTVAQDIAADIAKQLSNYGITVKLDSLDSFDTFIAKAFDPSQSEAFLSSYGSDLIDGSDPIISNFETKIYDDPQVDSLTTAAGKTLDQTKRLQDLQQASKLLMDQVAWLPIYNRANNYIYKPNLVIHDNALNSYYFWQVYQK